MTFFLLGLFAILGYLSLSNRIGRLEEALRSHDVQSPDHATPKPEKVHMRWELPPHAEQQSYEQPTPMAAKTSPARDKEFEFKIGSRVFTGVGVIAILLGTAFFLRYAFDNNLINETTRVALGLLGGTVLLVLGWLANKRYALFGQVITGGGIGLWYLSLYAAFNFYSLISQPTAFFFMIITTIAAAGLSMFYDAFPLAAFATIGGFATPLLLPSDTSNHHTLFLYITLLDLGIFALAWKKVWQYLTLGGFIGTTLVTMAWYGSEYSKDLFGLSFGYTTLFFLIFLVITYLHQLFKTDEERGVDIALACANPSLYFLCNFLTIDALYPDLTALFAFVLGIFYFVLGSSLYLSRNQKLSQHFSQILLGISFLFFIVTIPIQFEKHWITIWWGALGLILLTLGFVLRMRVARLSAMIAFTLTFVRLFALDIILTGNATAWLNSRFMTFFFISVLLALASLIFELKKREGFAQNLVGLEQDEFNTSISYLFVSLYIVSLVGIAAELGQFQKMFWLPTMGALWGLWGGVLSLVVSNKPLRALAYGTFVISAAHIVMSNGFIHIDTYASIFNTRVFVTLFFVASVALFAAVARARKSAMPEEERRLIAPLLFTAMNGMMLWLVSIEVADYFNQQMRRSRAEYLRLINMKRAALSVAWTLYSVALLIIGIIKKSTHARLSAICLFGVVVVKVFLVDTENLNDFYRFISFISLGVILLLSGFLYYRFRERILEFIKVEHS
ncbi:MAG: DUF2339 domain-containing protein [Candidatus Ryanbacteria bacterium]|nr:DUF2339 domain-containing protein [Candidatus Ryanbacteria bacterium]